MFVIKVRPGDRIEMTGDGDAEIVIFSNKDGEIKMGFDAPDSVRIKQKKNRIARKPRTARCFPPGPLGLSAAH